MLSRRAVSGEHGTCRVPGQARHRDRRPAVSGIGCDRRCLRIWVACSHDAQCRVSMGHADPRLRRVTACHPSHVDIGGLPCLILDASGRRLALWPGRGFTCSWGDRGRTPRAHHPATVASRQPERTRVRRRKCLEGYCGPLARHLCYGSSIGNAGTGASRVATAPVACLILTLGIGSGIHERFR